MGDRPRRFSDSYKQGKAVDNHSKGVEAKVSVRRHVLEEIGAENAAVLDCFAGAGHMHRAIWSKASSYTGVDERFFFDQRTAFVADNRILLRSIDLTPFNVFDLDAYGSPWEQALIIAKRRPTKPGSRIGIVLTEGSSLSLQFGFLPSELSQITGIPSKAAGVSRSKPEIMERAIVGLAKLMGCRVVRRWQALGKSGARLLYIGLVLEALTPLASAR